MPPMRERTRLIAFQMLRTCPQVPYLVRIPWIFLRVYSGGLVGLRGLLELKPGDAVLARPIHRGGDPLADCLQVLVGIKYVGSH